MTSASIYLKTAPLKEVISPADVRAHCRINITAEDSLIQRQITGVRRMVEQNYNLALISQTWVMQFDKFPKYVELYKWPVSLITSVKYLDSSNVLQTVDPLTYTSDLKAKPAVIYPLDSWPAADFTFYRIDRVQVEFKAGYGDNASDVPENVRQYLLIKVADAYENRESYTAESREKVDFIDGLISSERLF